MSRQIQERFRAPALPIATPESGAALPAMRASYAIRDRSRREFSSWAFRDQGPDADTVPALPDLRGATRDLARNDPVAAGAVSTHTTKAIGTGLLPQPRLDRALLGLDEADAAAWERRAKLLFYVWSAAADHARKGTFADLQEIAFRTQLLSGDVLAIRRYTKRPGDLLGLKIQLVEGDRITTPRDRRETPRLVAGVETDAAGAPVRYWVAEPDDRDAAPVAAWTPAAATRWASVPAFGAASGERLALHCYHQERAGQTRGVPLLAAAILGLKQASRYFEHELMRAAVSNMFTVFVKSPAPEVDPSTGAPYGYGLADGTGIPTALGIPAADANNGVGYAAPVPAGQVRMDAGAIVDLAPGEDVTFADPTAPNPQFEAFLTAVYQTVGPGVDIPYEILLKRFGSSYSASRAALLELWEAVLVRRARFARQFCQPSYEWFVAECVAEGLLDAPGFDRDPVLRAAWCVAEWVGPTPGQLDDLKAAQAAAARVTAGLSTLERETQQLTGADWEENHAQQAKEHQARRLAGLDAVAPPAPPAPPAADPETPDTAPMDAPALVGA
jgi:lambda family phage portal protein